MLKLLLALLVLLPISAHALNIPKENAIYRGTPVAPGGQGWKSTAKLSIGGGICTGVFIAHDLILTAAHCGDSAPWVDLEVTLFFENSEVATQLVIPQGQYKFYPHPEYVADYTNKKDTNDLALIVLKGETLPADFIPAEFFTSADASPPAIAYLVGAGLTHQGEVSSRLYFTKGSIDGYLEGDLMRIRTVPGQGLCKGDSGSPVFKPVGTALKLTAISVSVTFNLNKECGSIVYATYITQERYDWIMLAAEEGRAAE